MFSFWLLCMSMGFLCFAARMRKKKKDEEQERKSLPSLLSSMNGLDPKEEKRA